MFGFEWLVVCVYVYFARFVVFMVCCVFGTAARALKPTILPGFRSNLDICVQIIQLEVANTLVSGRFPPRPNV